MKKWYRIEAKASGVNIYIYSDVGFGVSAEEFVTELNGIKAKTINLHINSPGGSVFDGFTIYNALAQHPANVITVIDGLAASIASIIALAGDTVNMAENAFYMIHDPHALVMGTSQDMNKMAETLDKITSVMVNTYSAKTGMTAEEVQTLMDEETWYTAEEALNAGFADKVIKNAKSKKTASAAFDLSIFAHVPEELKNSAGALPTARELERLLRDAGGLSHAAAKAVLSGGLKTLDQRDAGDGGQRDADEAKTITNITINQGEKKMPEPTDATTSVPEGTPSRDNHIEVGAARTAGAAAERERTAELLAIGERFECSDLARHHIQAGTSVDKFRAAVLEHAFNGPPVAQDPNIGMNKKEVKQFSLLRGIRALVEGKENGRNPRDLAPFEFDASDAVAEKMGKPSQGFYFPRDVMTAPIQAVMTTGVPADGGNLVATELLASSFIELLRNKMVTRQLGARVLDGLQGNVAFPKQTGTTTMYWVAEDAPITAASQPAIGQVTMSPTTAGAYSDIGRRLILQSSVDVENLVREDLALSIALGLDLVVINGSGAANQPTGILNTTGIGDVAGGTNGAQPTWGNIVELETDVAAANADVSGMALLTSPEIRGRLKQTQRFTSTDTPLWETNNTINGYPGAVSNQIPKTLVKGTSSNCHAIIFGNWRDVLIGQWGSLDILVDPFTNSAAGTVRIRVLQDVDIAIRHAESFSAMQDALI